MILYGIERYFIEFLRDDPGRGEVFGGLMTGTQLISILLVLAGGLIWWFKSSVPKRVPRRAAFRLPFSMRTPLPSYSRFSPRMIAGQRLDHYLASQLSELRASEVSRARVQQLIERREVLVNRRAAKASLPA